MTDTYELDLVRRMASCLESGKYSDLTIICRGHEFHVHRAILCTASKFFQAACDGEFKEALSAKIDLSDDDPGALERMLKYFYTMDYDEEDPPGIDEKANSNDDFNTTNSVAAPKTPETHSNNDKDAASQGVAGMPILVNLREVASLNEIVCEAKRIRTSVVLNNVRVYALAEKYDVQPLKELSKGRFLVGSLSKWTLDDILTVLKQVFDTTPATDRGLRDIMLNVCSLNMDRLMVLHTFRQMLCSDATLAVDILDRCQNTKESLNHEVIFLKAELQSREHEKTGSQKALQSLRDQLKTAKDWATEETRVLRGALAKYATCRHCSMPLSTRTTKFNGKGNRKVVYLDCERCGDSCMTTWD